MLQRHLPLVAKMSAPDPLGTFIVQDEESGLFLTPISGDVGFTTFVRDAGLFDGIAEACDTAALNCHEGYSVIQIVAMNPAIGVVNPVRF